MKTVVLAVSGGIAAYKSAEIASRLKKDNFNVQCIMTKNACEFIAPLTLETLSNNIVITDMFDREMSWKVEHITLAQKADIMVIAPATANVIGKIANGIADDMLTTTIMAASSQILIAPAMNNAMYNNQAVENNISILKQRGFKFIGPESGLLACGDDDIGRMSEPIDIVSKIKDMLGQTSQLKDKKIIITAGPTIEKIDPVRYITNHSSGKMGYAIAVAAVDAGADVTLVTGPANIMLPKGADIINVKSTQQMYDAVIDNFNECDAIILAAAPSDFKPIKEHDNKIKKKSGLNLELISNPDIALQAGKLKKNQKIILFAAESENLIENATDKMHRKNADMIVANDITKSGAGFASDTNIVSIIKKNGDVNNYDIMPKTDLAVIIIEELTELMQI